MNGGLNRLEAVLAIARPGSFRAAARDLNMSTTPLSHTIARLEAAVGERLFNRTTPSVSLNDAGRKFVEDHSCRDRDPRSDGGGAVAAPDTG